ncbi:hypothetical protein NLG97_g5131 [Lecanicillium saksenae]|uniref:Uncharacterized protein n=1 Tax=Lecanicillium saksenae TaxID=468837 RepID=A0ACC1QVT3_9HYPO|nr:hypothetical protein NLG97_g5131 [Lecanicillium saksenae]
MSKTFTVSDVATHNKADNLYIIVDGDVYDVTKFQDDHPGGKKILQRVGGKDASKQFWKYHNEGILKKLTDAAGLPPLVIYVGQLDLFVKEDVRYATLFLQAGIDTELHVVPGLPHGFNGLAKDHRATKDLFDLSVRYLKRLPAE